MGSVDINMEEYKRFKEKPGDEPVVMLNLLKFKEPGGEEAYGKYASLVEKIILRTGAKVLYTGRAGALLTGNEYWDVVMLVKYPSRKAFLDMIKSEEYQEAHAYREEGLERAVLYETEPADLRK